MLFPFKKTASYFFKFLILSLKGPAGNKQPFPAPTFPLKQTMLMSYLTLLSCSPSSKIARLKFSKTASFVAITLFFLQKSFPLELNNFCSSN